MIIRYPACHRVFRVPSPTDNAEISDYPGHSPGTTQRPIVEKSPAPDYIDQIKRAPEKPAPFEIDDA
jgi:hypothetical protein